MVWVQEEQMMKVRNDGMSWHKVKGGDRLKSQGDRLRIPWAIKQRKQRTALSGMRWSANPTPAISRSHSSAAPAHHKSPEAGLCKCHHLYALLVCRSEGPPRQAFRQQSLLEDSSRHPERPSPRTFQLERGI